MLNRLFNWFRRDQTPRLVIVDYALEQERAAMQNKQIAYLHELGGFDTFFNNNEQNWARQAEILVEHKRRLDAIEAKLTKIID
jgi:hypothetical protein